MSTIIENLPNAGNLVAWVSILAVNLFYLRSQMKSLTSDVKETKKTVENNTTEIAVIKEQVSTVKAKLENGINSKVNEMSQRIARIEGHCESRKKSCDE